MAKAHPDGIVGSLGHNNKKSWYIANLDRFFRPNEGPLSYFAPASYQVVQRHVSHAQALAKVYYTRDHSNDQSGANQEDVPEWAQAFYRLFEDSQITNSEATRNERRQVVTSLTGRQAPLGYRGDGPAELRTETSRNEGAVGLQARIVGNVSVEEIPVSNVGNEEGVNDTENRRRAPIRVTNNGPRRRNVHIGGGSSFGAGTNDPSSRFENIRNAYASLDRLTSAVATSFEQQQPQRRMIDIVREYSETLKLRNDSSCDEDRDFYQSALTVLKSEMNALSNANSSITNQP